MKRHCRAGTISGPGVWPQPSCYLWWASLFGVISVLSVPVLQSSQDYEGGADAALHLPGQHVPAWAEEPLANPLPHRSGFPVFASDTDKAASGQAVWLWSVRLRPWDGRILWFSFEGHRRFPFYSLLHLKFPSLKFLSTKADWSWEPRFFSPVQWEAWSCWTPGLGFLWELLQNLQFSTLDSRIWEPSQKAHYWKTNIEWFWSFTLSDAINQ